MKKRYKNVNQPIKFIKRENKNQNGNETNLNKIGAA